MKDFKLKRTLLLAASLLLASLETTAQVSAEYQVKAGFLYNFIAFTEWPARVGSPLPLCVYDMNPFGNELHALEGKTVNGRVLTIRSPVSLDQLHGCRVLFVARSAFRSLPRILEVVRGEPVLIVADSKDALDAGVGINMLSRQGKIAFEVNLPVALHAELSLSSKLLRLASEVRQ